MAELMEIILTSTYFNQTLVNRLNYVANGTPAAVSLSYALASAFGAIYDTIAVPPAYPANTPMSAISGVISSATIFNNIVAKDVYSSTDFYDTAFIPAYGGGRSGQPSSPTLAWGFRTNIVDTRIKRGQKRFGGVSEDDVENGGVPSGDHVARLDNLAAKLSAVLTYDDEGNSITFTPAVVHKEKYPVPDSSPVRYAYRYYADKATQLGLTAVGVVWSRLPTVRSQVSRQYGRGI